MRDSPTTRDFGNFYHARKAASDLRSYRHKGPIPSTRMLIQVSAARARRLYGLVYPRNTLPVKMVVALMNRLVWRGPVDASVRPPDVIDKLASEAGFVRFFSKTTGPWEVALFRRRRGKVGWVGWVG